MRLRKVTLREVRMPLVAPFETSMDRTTERRFILVEANVDASTGWGECVASENPSYSPETVETAWHILKGFLWPLLKGKEFESAADLLNPLEWVPGPTMAKAPLQSP